MISWFSSLHDSFHLGRSEMLVPLIKQSILFRVILASPVHVELGVQAAEFVRLILAVVSSQVVVKSGHHVCMLLTSTD